MLTYAGVPLCLPDADSELASWMYLNQDLADLKQFSYPTLPALSPRRGLLAWGGDRKGVGQSFANYSPPPPPRLNSLYWPMGATRWARGWFIATEENKDKIVEQAHAESANAPLPLRWGDPDDKTVLTTSMYLLPPRAISHAKVKHEASESLWLLPLVDARYWWQFRDTDDLEIGDEEGQIETWAELFEELSDRLNVTVSLPTAVPAVYLKPDHYEFTRRFENAAVMLDAAALSVGKRIVRWLDGTVRAESYNNATTAVFSNDNLRSRIIAGTRIDVGGEVIAGDAPEKVLVTFRKWRHYRLLQKGQVYTVEEDPPEGIGSTPTGTRKVFHSTLMADYSSDSSPPGNSSDLDALAEQIAADYYGWLTYKYDITYVGAQPWKPTGFDDSVIWDFGRPHGVERLAQTRVQSVNSDFGFDLQLSQDPDKSLLESPVLGKISGSSIAKDAYGTVKVWDGRSPTRAESEIEIEAFASAVELSDNSKLVACNWVNDDWEVGPWECQ